MCGIAGISSGGALERGALTAALGRMLEHLRHRGPDDSGLEFCDDGNVAIGNTRLAVLDLTTAGHQPMWDRETGNGIAFNGEIYNHLELRKELCGKADGWKSSSDTETVLRAYSAWGSGCVSRLRGMFAFSLWDRVRGELFCARDRLGIKPFYFGEHRGALAFASEVRALLSSGMFARSVDPSGLAGFVRFGSIQDPLALITGISSLPAGHWMRIKKGKVTATEEYWAPGRASSTALRDRNGGHDAAAQLRAHLERSIANHLVSDVPVASFLSGGVDSSIVTAVAARKSTRPLHTITLAFEDRGLDESVYAQQIVRKYGTEQHRILLNEEEVVELIPQAVQSMDLPSADGLNTFVVSRKAAECGIKVVLSGLGGDELFGGYRSFGMLAWANRLSPLLKWAAPLASTVARRTNGSVERRVELLSGSNLSERYETLRSLWSMREMEGMGLNVQAGYRANGFRTGWELPTRVSWLELAGYMKSTLLRDADAMSMAHSIELRVPYLDHELVDWCLDIGAATYSGTSGRKALLLDATADLLPGDIGTRRKQGFVLPMKAWMKGPLHGYVSAGLANLTRSSLLPAIDLEALHQRFRNDKLPWARLWQFTVLGHWLEQNIT